mmetsp:Transcript_3593/g.11314  ORF Transcript_3593/g.11314 Transcript_3593/m.11314 type:complete len:174 (-) Transcript_3593:3712-4233(-)
MSQRQAGLLLSVRVRHCWTHLLFFGRNAALDSASAGSSTRLIRACLATPLAHGPLVASCRPAARRRTSSWSVSVTAHCRSANCRRHPTAGTPHPHCCAAERRRRAHRQQSALSMLSSATLSVGLRNETGTLELLSPRFVPGGTAPTKEPHFSFVLPLADPEVNLGPGAAPAHA